MTARGDYREALRALDDWEDYLLENSGLPGPRGNIELGQAAADEGSVEQFEHWLSFDVEGAPVNTPPEFLHFCGVLGLGRLLAEGRLELLVRLRELANDSRWRTREAVAMALQRYGEQDMPGLLQEMRRWSSGSRLEQRAAAAAICEPKLLHSPEHAQTALGILDAITESMVGAADRKSEQFRALRKGQGYTWSVAVAASPADGLPCLEKWCAVDDPDVRWIMRQNLKKKRLQRADPDWVEKWAAQLEG